MKTLEEINEELKNYPSPITGCDAQYSFLLSEKNRLEREAQGLEETEIVIFSREQDHAEKSS